MRTVSFQGIQLSASERARAALQASLRSSIVANPALLEMPAVQPAPYESREDRERRRYWEIVAEFKRFARTEILSDGTPWVGDAFGF